MVAERTIGADREEMEGIIGAGERVSREEVEALEDVARNI